MKKKIILGFVLFTSTFVFAQEKKPSLELSNKLDSNKVISDSNVKTEMAPMSKVNQDKKMSKTKNKVKIDNKPALSMGSSIND